MSDADDDPSVTKLRQVSRWSLHLTSYGATVGSSSRVASIPAGLESGDCSMTPKRESVDPGASAARTAQAPRSLHQHPAKFTSLSPGAQGAAGMGCEPVNRSAGASRAVSFAQIATVARGLDRVDVALLVEAV